MEDTRECSRPGDIDGVLTTLRARFGLSPREARAQLAGMQREHRTPLQAHGTEVTRLVNMGHAELRYRQQIEMSLKVLSTTLGHSALQRHLLAVRALNMWEAVRGGYEYIQIQTDQ